MEDGFRKPEFNDEYGMSYTFSSPLTKGEFFSLIPEKNIPHYYSPIIDEEYGLCIGYINKGNSDIYDVYDYNGYFVNRMEVPLEHPFLDPIDLLLIGGIIYKSFRFGLYSFKALTRRGVFVEFSSLVGESIMNTLRGRLKFGLSPETLRFSRASVEHMAESGRYVPVYILEKAIRYGRRMPDLLRKSNMKTIRYEITIRRSRYNNMAASYENKDYTLEVIVNERTWTITHFAYK
ncbi:hypothetical protein R4P48_17930 [Atlantibacter subterranea]|uniref:Uncharacterized protein n=1 Tax=Atlantibacter subterraneus TaxID=255519 RepID=A0ABU4E647_9ENTR|nr:hypothetical protein [Atlantibacter subterranea]MDV7024546.1 hypothetical protein [Atlantibacter subterranea]MDZ5667643.1 hypothetical protein [Atlantibacter hermannii]